MVTIISICSSQRMRERGPGVPQLAWAAIPDKRGMNKEARERGHKSQIMSIEGSRISQWGPVRSDWAASNKWTHLIRLRAQFTRNMNLAFMIWRLWSRKETTMLLLCAPVAKEMVREAQRRRYPGESNLIADWNSIIWIQPISYTARNKGLNRGKRDLASKEQCHMRGWQKYKKCGWQSKIDVRQREIWLQERPNY